MTFSKAGYTSKTLDVTLVAGQVSNLTVTLDPIAAYTVTGKVVNSITGQPVPNAQILLSNNDNTYTFVADAQGQFSKDCFLGGDYQASAGLWGYKLTQNVSVNANTDLTLSLTPGYYDDFAFDYGWTNSATATSGDWVRDVPIGTTYQNNDLVNPGADSPLDNNDKCYMTGNGGGSAGTDDVDGGSVVLTSPKMKLSTWSDAILNYQFWFYNNGGNSTPNDNLVVKVTNGTQTVTVATYTQSQSQWRPSGDIHLAPLLNLNDDVQVIFIARDTAPGHLVEAAVDVFSVSPTLLSTSHLDEHLHLAVSPNPSSDFFAVKYDMESLAPQNARLTLTNLLGETVLVKNISANNGFEKLGAELPSGVYFLQLENDGKRSAPTKLVKQ